MNPREEKQMLLAAAISGAIFVACGMALFAVWSALPEFLMMLAIPVMAAFVLLGWYPIFNAVLDSIQKSWPR